ncbi:MAG: DUF4492 domain-containing protein [Chlorobi bacterium]|nr:DUF4492 domain-containing protein [Chlorobiota bacterium]
MISRIFKFYVDGFKNMASWGRTLWLIILLKLFILFFIFKLIFFSDTLETRYDTDGERAEHVINAITK